MGATTFKQIFDEYSKRALEIGMYEETLRDLVDGPDWERECQRDTRAPVQQLYRTLQQMRQALKDYGAQRVTGVES